MSTDSADISWDIPGGRINSDEELHDALHREIKEEIGNDIQIVSPQLVAAQDIIVSAKDLHVIRLTYILEADISDIRLSHEHTDYKWAMVGQFDSIYAEPYLRKVYKIFHSLVPLLKRVSHARDRPLIS